MNFSQPTPTAPYPVDKRFLDFRVFLIYVWRSLGLPDPTPVQMELAYYMQHGPRRKVIEAFRGVGKSWIASAFVLWCLYLWPDLKFLIVSASKERADNFTTFTMRLIKELPLLAPLKPSKDEGDRDSKISFDVGPAKPDHSPSVKSVGIFGQLTGTRADVIIPDDVEVANNSATQAMRDKLSEAIKEFDAILKPDGIITYLGTPQTEQSIYNTLPDRGYETRIWPARYPIDGQLRNYGDKIAPGVLKGLRDGAVPGTSTDPKRFDDDDLREREMSYGRSGFALQFMLDTALSDSDRYPLKINDLIVMNCNPMLAPEQISWSNSPNEMWDSKLLPCVGLQGDRFYRPKYTSDTWLEYCGGGYMAIDPSGRGKDETSYAVVKQLNGFLYCTAAGGLIGGYDKTTLKSLAEIAKEQKVGKIIVESNFGDGMFTELFKPILAKYHRCEIEEVRHNKQKELRIIDTLEPLMSSHRLIIDMEVVKRDYLSTYELHKGDENLKRYMLMYQLSRITRDRGSLNHEDRLDALAMACGAWVEAMALDAKDQVQDRQDALLEMELMTWENDTLSALPLRKVMGMPDTEVMDLLGYSSPFAEGAERVLVIGDGPKRKAKYISNPTGETGESWFTIER